MMSISQRVFNHYKGINLRVWGCFGEHEDKERFFYRSINNYIQKKDIVIYKDMIYKDIGNLYKLFLYKSLCFRTLDRLGPPGMHMVSVLPF